MSLEKTKQNIENRYKAHQRIIHDISSGFFKNFKEEKKDPLRQIDPDKMNNIQLLSEGFRQLDEKQKEEEGNKND